MNCIVEGGEYLTLAASRKHKSICLHCGQSKLDLNDVCETGIALSSSAVRMLIVTSRPARTSYAPARGAHTHTNIRERYQAQVYIICTIYTQTYILCVCAFILTWRKHGVGQIRPA